MSLRKILKYFAIFSIFVYFTIWISQTSSQLSSSNSSGSSKSNYKGKIVEGWPPDKDRNVANYVKPGENNFLIQPSFSHFSNCDLLIVIHSTIENFSSRQALRDTWIKFISEEKVQNVSYVFLVGSQNIHLNVTNSTLEKLQDESEEFDDILQADFIDHYFNLTLKTVFTLKFFMNESNFEENPPFHVMKIDNDAYLNLPQLMKELQKLRSKSELYIFGHKFEDRKQRKPNRNTKSKWWTPKYLFKGRYFPAFVSGSGFVTTRPACKCLYDTALVTPFFHLEDVFLTGIVAEKCSIPRENSAQFNFLYTYISDLKENDILWHYLGLNSLRYMHRIFFYGYLEQENAQLKS